MIWVMAAATAPAGRLQKEAVLVSGVPSCAAGVPIFQMLPPEGLHELGLAMHHRSISRGERLAAAGEPVSHLVVVARGRLKVSHATRSGREQVVRTLGPGEFLGEMALFAAAIHEGDLVALEETDVCLLPREAVQSSLLRHPSVALRLVEALSQRLSEAEQLIADLGLRDVGQRLAAELLRLAQGVAPSPDGSVKVRSPVPWAEMAFRLGTTPESLSRRLRAMSDQGLVSQSGVRTVVLRDVDRIRALAQA